MFDLLIYIEYIIGNKGRKNKMTIKELFKKVEAINEANRLFNKEEQKVYIDLGYGDSNTYTTYKEFVKHFRKEFVKDYVETVLSMEIIIDNDYGYIQADLHGEKIIICIG